MVTPKKEASKKSDIQPFGLKVAEGEAASTERSHVDSVSRKRGGGRPHSVSISEADGHAKRVRFQEPVEKRLGIVLNKRIDDLLNAQDVIYASKGAAKISARQRHYFKQFVANLESDDVQKDFLTNMEQLVDSGKVEVVDDILKKTTTTTPSSDVMDISANLPTAVPAVPEAVPSSTSPLSVPSSPPADSNVTSQNGAVTPPPAQKASYRLPREVTEHEHHNCHLGFWLVASGVLGVVGDATNKTTDVVTNIMKELSKAHGSNDQWGLAVTITEFLAQYVKLIPSMLAVATLHKVVEVAGECAEAGHISKSDLKRIDEFCEREIKQLSPVQHKEFKIDTAARSKAADEAEAKRLAREEPTNITQDTHTDLVGFHDPGSSFSDGR